ncbi:Eukaryotic translation initiation factor 2 subunit alpha [Sesamum angolense]|uniref:Eukaryotic translation initiation factor 2 subunit alpha n=1 Tax=Sesamum angolense TaxID=2727404 RepID=A0AAE1W7Y3_9LAMI|nr:Eukaryotic translation initiation factor 2 subunit alpha [Sesamum angolense]
MKFNPNMAPNLNCRMYEQKFPEMDTPVMIQVKSINPGTCAYVSLLEYDDMEAMLSFTELSRRRIRSIASLVRIGRVEPVMVLHVDPDKGFVNLSKRRISQDDATACLERYNKSKHVHSILRHVAETMDVHLEELYIHVGWPLYRKYGHAFEAFKLIVSDPDSVLNSLTREVEEIGDDGHKVIKVVPAISDEVKQALVENIQRRVMPQAIKVRAEVEIKCFELDGVLHIKKAMRRAEATGNEDSPVKMSLEQGIEVLNKAISACTEEIERHKGKVSVKTAPRAVIERDQKLLAEDLSEINLDNDEVLSSDLDSEEEEDT